MKKMDFLDKKEDNKKGFMARKNANYM